MQKYKVNAQNYKVNARRFKVNAQSFSSECAKFLKSMRKVNARKLKIDVEGHCSKFKLQSHDPIYRLRFYSNSFIHILSLSNLHNNVASLQKNRDDKSHRVIVA